jgi:hypothetical protein
MKRLEKLRDEKARNSVNRNMLELHEADGRERHYKQGFDCAVAELMPQIEKLAVALKRSNDLAQCEHIYDPPAKKYNSWFSILDDQTKALDEYKEWTKDVE